MTNLTFIFSKIFLINMSDAIATIEKHLSASITINALIKHFIEVIIHDSSYETVQNFLNVVDEYTSLWTSKKFVELSQKNWMRISLKADWKFKIKSKPKIYCLKIKNKIIVDEVFDKLYEQDRLLWTSKAILFNFSCFVV